MGYGSILSRSRKASSFYPTIRIVGVTGDKIPTIQKGKAVAISEAVGSNYIAKPWAFGEYEVKVDGVTIAKVKVTQLIEYSVAAPSSTLNDCSWETIRIIADQGVGANYWNVGDRKAVILNGTVGALTLSNYTTYCFILGFNHNAELEGSNTIHFQFGKTALSGGTDIAFVDAGYENQYTASTSARFVMESANTNSGGWASSYMRNAICSTFLSAFPTELQSNVIEINKYTDNTGGGQDIADYVTATKDKNWLLSEFEIQGVRTNANTNEQNKQIQYAYYKSGNSKIKYKYNSTSISCVWWTRSVSSTSVAFFVWTLRAGTSDTGGSMVSVGFAPAFAV